MKVNICKYKDNITYYLAKTIRKGKKITTKNFERIGTHQELLLKHPDPLKYCKEYAKEKTKAEKQDLLEKYTVYFKKQQFEPIQVDSNSELYNVGYFFLKYFYDKLKIKSFLGNLTKDSKIKYNPNTSFEYLVYSRILNPKSKRGSFGDFKNFYGKPESQFQDIFKTMDIFNIFLKDFQIHLYNESNNIIKRDTTTLYYDCTNYFFETDNETELLRYGVSKEHRPNPIVQMGLFMDGSGVPLMFDIFPGNQNEQRTPIELEHNIIKDFKISKFIYCADAGLGANSTRLFNSIRNRDFLVTQSLKKLKKEDLNLIMTDDNWYDPETMRNDICLSELDDDDDKIYIKILPVNNPIDIGYKEYTRNMQIKKKSDFNQTVIVSFSKKQQKFQRQVRQKQIARASNLILKGRVEKETENSPKRFIKKLNEKNTYILDYEKIGYEAQFDGFYAVATSLDKDYKTISNIMRRRWQIEESFRILKTNLKARPVFHRDEDRIKVHFLICFVALLIYRILEKKLEYKYSINQIIKALNETVVLPVNNGANYIAGYKGSEILTDLNRVCEKELDYPIFLNTELNSQKYATYKKEIKK